MLLKYNPPHNIIPNKIDIRKSGIPTELILNISEELISTTGLLDKKLSYKWQSLLRSSTKSMKFFEKDFSLLILFNKALSNF